jgi:hypothetical protein
MATTVTAARRMTDEATVRAEPMPFGQCVGASI